MSSQETQDCLCLLRRLLHFTGLMAIWIYRPLKAVSWTGAESRFVISVPVIYARAFIQERAATRRPNKRPSMSASSKWTPPYRRDMPASSAAWVNVVHESTTSCDGPGLPSIPETPAGLRYDPPNLSLPVNRSRISAADALSVLCEETKSGNAGVCK